MTDNPVGFNRMDMGRRMFVSLLAGAMLNAPRPGRGCEGDMITDCRGRHVKVGPARHIASIGGTITETLYALGMDRRIIAVDMTATWPERALHEKKSVGYMRALSAEGILSLQPDLILAMNDSGPPPVLDQLMASAVPVVFVDATPSQEAILARTRFLADLMDAKTAGAQLCADIAQRFDMLAQWRAAHPVTRRVLFIMRMNNNRPMVAGTNTAADAVIRLAGGANPATFGGYRILDQEALIDLRPDAVLTMEQDAPQVRTALLGNAGFRLTPAGKSHAIIGMEGERLLGFGPRTPDAALELAHRLQGIGMPA
ncbi:heme/hemin ABC transporter substrate-binding protein [Komagataeibacter diospyri]|uniref:Hemin ABC transporter hemin-binding protein n=1 Tax=Komagataeibacter diospyri TaxID=1932662 RepID=A0A4P5NLQ9_9PROT|nr:ABC transporter substrate-binding protein [Komagataeibacter diospyri]GCE82660.1 hemin ABC transporter hemin-binding protein [Komagataeibacter diospyri]